MTEPRRLVFWRHGRTSWNAEQRFQGQIDTELDSTGLEQARRAASMLATLAPSRIIASDLTRTVQTAGALAELSGLQVETDPRLRETFAGDWEGLTRSELEARFGGDLSAWSAGSDIRPGGTGETRREVAERVHAAVDDALAILPPGQTLVLVTHGGAARAGVGSILGLPPDHWSVLGVLTNCSWTVLQENVAGIGAPWRLQEYNAGTLPEPALADDR